MRASSLVRSFGLVAFVLFATTAGVSQSFSFAPIDVPCSGCPGGIATSTIAFGINAPGEIVGTWNDATGFSHGFLLNNGKFTTIDVPGWLIGASGTLPTAARGINPEGVIVGSFTAPVSSAPPSSTAYCPSAGSTYCIKGFLYAHGKFSLLLFPGHMGAIAQRITPDGGIYGCLHDFNMASTMYGFGMSHFGDSSLQLSGGELASGNPVPSSMENGATPGEGISVGLYADATGFAHGYIVENGVFRTWDVPGPMQTNIYDINPEGDFVGIYIDGGGHRHGFLQMANEPAPITLTYPGAVHTRAYAVNPELAIVGQYIDSAGHSHGFLAVPDIAN